MLAQELFYDFMHRPDMVQNIQWMFVLHRPKRNVDIKVERRLHDMRIWVRVLCARGTHLVPPKVAAQIVRVRSMKQSIGYVFI